MSVPLPPACGELRAAILDGRFLADPAFWRPHVEDCADCREYVEGLFALRHAIEQVELATPVPRESARSAHLIESIIEDHGRRQRRRNSALGLVLLVAASCLGAVGGREPADVTPTSAAAYAHRLWRITHPGDSRADYARLRTDVPVREEFVRALDHPSLLVRVVAVDGLLKSGEELGLARVLSLLEDPAPIDATEAPLQQASLSGDERAVAEAMESRREAMLGTVLRGLAHQAAIGKWTVAPSEVLHFLDHLDPGIRQLTLKLLGASPDYVPGPEARRALRDSDGDVRLAAADAIRTRLGETGVDELVSHFRAVKDYGVERRIIGSLAKFPSGFALCVDRADDPAVDPGLGMTCANLLFARTGRLPSEALIERSFASGDGQALVTLAEFARVKNWLQYRDRLLAAWETAEVDYKYVIGPLLARWDVDSGEKRRLESALRIAENYRGDSTYQAILTRLAASEFESIARRAKVLLAELPKK